MKKKGLTPLKHFFWIAQDFIGCLFVFFYNLPGKLDNLLGKLDLAIAYFLVITYREESSLKKLS